MRAGLTGDRLAELTGFSQPKVSRIETGRTLPTVADLALWAQASGANDAERQELVEMLEAVATEAVSWRLLHRLGLRHKQEDIAQLEQASRIIRVFQPVMVPGLLQTAEYARRVMVQGNLSDQGDVAGAVAARMERQAILYDQGKTFEFLITEGALRWWPGPAQVMLPQLDRVSQMATLPNVEVGIIPFGIEAPDAYCHQFVIFEDDDEIRVTAETYTTELTTNDLRDIAVYQLVMERFRKVAQWQERAISLIRMIIAEVSKGMKED